MSHPRLDVLASSAVSIPDRIDLARVASAHLRDLHCLEEGVGYCWIPPNSAWSVLGQFGEVWISPLCSGPKR